MIQVSNSGRRWYRKRMIMTILLFVLSCWSNTSNQDYYGDNWKSGCILLVNAQQQQQQRKQQTKQGYNDHARNEETTSSSSSSLLQLPKAPKHVGDGIVQGISIVITGMMTGIALAFSLPLFAIFQQPNATTIIASLLIGSLSGIIIGSGSLLYAILQLGQSIVPTYYAIRSGYDGTIYDTFQGVWTTHSLQQSKSQLLPTMSTENNDYYQLLELSYDATEQDIKRAYRKKARIVHPDKDTSDQAIQQFQQLTRAYQTLLDPTQRHNLYGGTTNANQNLDVSLIFQFLLGMYNHKTLLSFLGGNVRIINDLQLLNQLFSDKLENLSTSNKRPELSPQDVQEFFQKRNALQQKRIYDTATFLRSKLITFDNEKDDWKSKSQEQQSILDKDILPSLFHSTKLKQDYAIQTFLPFYVHEIGQAIVIEAEEFLAFQSYSPSKTLMAIQLPFQLFLQGPFHKLTSLFTYQIPNKVSSYWNIFQSIRTLLFQKSTTTSNSSATNVDEDSLWDLLKKIPTMMTSEQQSQEDILQSIFQKQFSTVIPSILEIVWKFIQSDIRDTIKQSVQYLIKDGDVSYAERVQRAKALQLMGRTLLHSTSGCQKKKYVIHDYFWNHTDVSARLQMAFTISSQKAKMNDPSIIPSASEREKLIQQIIVQNQKEKNPLYSNWSE